jgi:hypothetical protein
MPPLDRQGLSSHGLSSMSGSLQWAAGVTAPIRIDEVGAVMLISPAFGEELMTHPKALTANH